MIDEIEISILKMNFMSILYVDLIYKIHILKTPVKRKRKSRILVC